MTDFGHPPATQLNHKERIVQHRGANRMPRYYFHVVHRRGWGRDREGTELPDLRHAHVHAMRLLLEARTCFADIATHSGWLIQVTDEEERSKLTVLFPAALAAVAQGDAVGPPAAMEV